MHGLLKKYFKINTTMCLTTLWAVVLLVLCIRLFELFFSGRFPGLLFYVLFPIFSALLWGFIRLFTYPVVYDDALEMRWMLLPFLNRRFNFNEIERIDIVQSSSESGGINMTVFLKKGKKKKYPKLLCMRYAEVPMLIEQLQGFGVNVVNKMQSHI